MILRRHSWHSRSGFSIIEMIVAICILGAVFVMTLGGKSLVDTMRAFMTSYRMQIYQAQVQAYAAEFHHLPGDDPTAILRYDRPPATSPVNGVPADFTGDSILNGHLSDTLNANGEPFMAWRDLRYAKLIEGDPELAGASAMPENPFGGVYGFDEGNLGQSGGSLCATRVPGRAAQIIDKRLDDGVVNKGRVVATSKYSVEDNNHFPAPDSEPYDFEKEYIICAPILP